MAHLGQDEVPDVAAAWLNYIIGSAPAKAAMFKSRRSRPSRVPRCPPATACSLRRPRAFQQLSKDAGLTLYTDWASTSMYDTLAKDFQLVVAGKTSPADAAKAIQADWTSFDATLSSAVAVGDSGLDDTRRPGEPRGGAAVRRRKPTGRAPGEPRNVAWLSHPPGALSPGLFTLVPLPTRAGSRSSTGTG